jgi:hypothetical protein
VTKEKDANVSKLEMSEASPKKRKCRPRGIEGIQAKEDRKRTLDPIENL